MKTIPRKSDAVVADASSCHGCGICELACSLSHSGACGPSLARIRVLRDPLAGEFIPDTCRQCSYPSCYFSCPSEAVFIEPKTGARIIDSEKCKGCGACVKACPYNEQGTVIKADSSSGKYFKCDLCSGIGRGPVCVEACPWGALSYVPADGGQGR